MQSQYQHACKHMQQGHMGSEVLRSNTSAEVLAIPLCTGARAMHAGRQATTVVHSMHHKYYLSKSQVWLVTSQSGTVIGAVAAAVALPLQRSAAAVAAAAASGDTGGSAELPTAAAVAVLLLRTAPAAIAGVDVGAGAALLAAAAAATAVEVLLWTIAAAAVASGDLPGDPALLGGVAGVAALFGKSAAAAVVLAPQALEPCLQHDKDILQVTSRWQQVHLATLPADHHQATQRLDKAEAPLVVCPCIYLVATNRVHYPMQIA